MGISISAVICTYNRPEFLKRAVESLRAQDLPVDKFDIWVIDNGTPSNSSQYHDINYVTLDTPGLSNARNVALARSQASYIAFLDDDAVAKPNWLREILTTFDGDPQVAVVGGTILPDFSAPRPVWLDDKLLPYLSVVDYGGIRRAIMPDSGIALAGANIAFHRQRALDAGGFDVSLGRKGGGFNLLSGEETALVSALFAQSHTAWYVPEAVVSHHIPPERLTRGWFRRRAGWHSVTEQIEGDLAPARVIDYWQAVIGYMQQVPPEQRHLFGLLWDVDNSDLFYRQVMATRAFVRLLLAQGMLPAEITGNN